MDEKSQLTAAYTRERKHASMLLIHFAATFHVLNAFHLLVNCYSHHPYNQFMLLFPPSVAKREPESSELSSSDILTYYEDDLPNSAALDTELHCWGVKWRGKKDGRRKVL